MSLVVCFISAANQWNFNGTELLLEAELTLLYLFHYQVKFSKSERITFSDNCRLTECSWWNISRKCTRAHWIILVCGSPSSEEDLPSLDCRNGENRKEARCHAASSWRKEPILQKHLNWEVRFAFCFYSWLSFPPLPRSLCWCLGYILHGVWNKNTHMLRVCWF